MRFVATDQNVLGRVLLPEHQRLKGNQQFLCRGSFRTLQRTPLSLFYPWKNGTEPDFYAVAQAPLYKYPEESDRQIPDLVMNHESPRQEVIQRKIIRNKLIPVNILRQMRRC